MILTTHDTCTRKIDQMFLSIAITDENKVLKVKCLCGGGVVRMNALIIRLYNDAERMVSKIYNSRARFEPVIREQLYRMDERGRHLLDCLSCQSNR